jgi:hypothetical protein
MISPGSLGAGWVCSVCPLGGQIDARRAGAAEESWSTNRKLPSSEAAICSLLVVLLADRSLLEAASLGGNRVLATVARRVYRRKALSRPRVDGKKDLVNQLGREAGKNSLEIGKEEAYAPRGLEFEQPACAEGSAHSPKARVTPNSTAAPETVAVICGKALWLGRRRVCVAKVK